MEATTHMYRSSEQMLQNNNNKQNSKNFYFTPDLQIIYYNIINKKAKLIGVLATCSSTNNKS